MRVSLMSVRFRAPGTGEDSRWGVGNDPAFARGRGRCRYRNSTPRQSQSNPNPKARRARKGTRKPAAAPLHSTPCRETISPCLRVSSVVQFPYFVSCVTSRTAPRAALVVIAA